MKDIFAAKQENDLTDTDDSEPPECYNNWHWQFSHRVTDPADIVKHSELTGVTALELEQVAKVYPMAITPYYLSLINWHDPNCPIRLQSLPNQLELNYNCSDFEDPLNEEQFSPVPGLIHRYPDRVLLMLTIECATYCRHCTRKRKVGDIRAKISKQGIGKGIEYINANPQIRDVLLSGGDPFVLDDGSLEDIISAIRKIPHVEIIRIGTRVPVVMPQRITTALANMLKKYHPIWINTHFNHPLELTAEAKGALAVLADAGIPLGNQTVLLKGINDSAEIIKSLIHQLVKNRVRPYYLYHCDYSRGVQHFRTPFSKGLEIMQKLIGFTSGFSIPNYVIDIPGGGGKIPLWPEYMQVNTNSEIIVRNFEGNYYSLGNPDDAQVYLDPVITGNVNTVKAPV